MYGWRRHIAWAVYRWSRDCTRGATYHTPSTGNRWRVRQTDRSTDRHRPICLQRALHTTAADQIYLLSASHVFCLVTFWPPVLLALSLLLPLLTCVSKLLFVYLLTVNNAATQQRCTASPPLLSRSGTCTTVVRGAVAKLLLFLPSPSLFLSCPNLSGLVIFQSAISPIQSSMLMTITGNDDADIKMTIRLRLVVNNR